MPKTETKNEEIKSDNDCFLKVESSIAIWEARHSSMEKALVKKNVLKVWSTPLFKA